MILVVLIEFNLNQVLSGLCINVDIRMDYVSILCPFSFLL